LLKAPVVHTDLSPPAALAAPHEHRAAAAVEVELVKIELFLDAQAGAREDSDQSAGAISV
jgi:hypothetical protein